MTAATWALGTTFVGGIATLGIYSFFIKENAFYRFFEHLYIGIAAGFAPIYTFRYFLWPKILVPMLGVGGGVFPDGTPVAPYESLSLLYLLPMAFGLLYYTIYVKRFSWMVKLVIGFSLGFSAALSFKGFFNEMIPQLVGSLKPLLVRAAEGGIDIAASFSNTFFVLTLLLVLNYFFFTFKREGRIHQPASHGGRWLLMICFGSFFGSTVMARLALLVERLQFLYGEWWIATLRIFGVGG